MPASGADSSDSDEDDFTGSAVLWPSLASTFGAGAGVVFGLGAALDLAVRPRSVGRRGAGVAGNSSSVTDSSLLLSAICPAPSGARALYLSPAERNQGFTYTCDTHAVRHKACGREPTVLQDGPVSSPCY